MSSPVALCAFYLILNYVGVQSREYKDVQTSEGVVRGHLVKEGDYIAYLGVPYAAPPTGKNRFRAPLPPLPWDGIYDANNTIRCPQNGRGDEDCLVLNVFTPAKRGNANKNSLLPVLIYIHGGSFLIGTGQIQGVEPLIMQNIIVVTVNYRLGALGFLCLGIEEAPGNAGLKDQVAAFRWVKNNIAKFGGDPNQVTIYGMSAGGASVEYHVLSEMSKDLFQRAIVESGSATSVWTVDNDPIKTAMEMAELLNFPKKTNNLCQLVDYYQHISADILTAMNYDYYSNLTSGQFGFVPCVERKLPNVDAFITESPHEVLTKQKYKQIPMMFFFATLEGLYLRSEEYYKDNYRERMDNYFPDFIPSDLIFDSTEIRYDIARNIKHFYFGNVSVSDSDVTQYLNYFGDNLIMHGLLNSVEIHSRNDNPVYLLEFAYKGSMGSYEQFYEHINVAGHGDVVKHAILNRHISNRDDFLAVTRVAKLIGNFVKYGNPTPNRSQTVPVIWPTVVPSNVNYLHLDKAFQVFEEPYWGRKVFWDQIYGKFRRNITAVNPGIL